MRLVRWWLLEFKLLAPFEFEGLIGGLLGQLKGFLRIVVNGLLQKFDGLSVLLLAVDVHLLLLNQVVTQLVSVLPLLVELAKDLVILAGPVLGTNFNSQVFVLNTAVFCQFD